MTTISIKLSSENILALIGDSPEARFEITSSIVQQFTNAHLKGLLNHELMHEIDKSLRAGLRQEITDYAGKWVKPAGINQKAIFEMHETIKNQISNIARSAVVEAFEALVKEAVECRQPWIDDAVSRVLGTNIREMVDTEVQRRLAAAAGV